MQRAHKNKRGKRNKPTRRTRPLYQGGVVVPRTPVLMPDEFPIKLKWRMDGVMKSAPSVAVRVHTNALWDVDPDLGGYTVNGFTTYSRLYSFNRVTRCHVKVSLSNQEAGAVRLNFIHSNTDPGESPASYENWAMSQYGYTRMLGSASGNSNFLYQKTIDPRRLIGDRISRTSERYVGSSIANPVDVTYFGFSVEEANGFEMTNGVAFTLELTLFCQFFDRKIVDEMFAPKPKPNLVQIPTTVHTANKKVCAEGAPAPAGLKRFKN